MCQLKLFEEGQEVSKSSCDFSIFQSRYKFTADKEYS